MNKVNLAMIAQEAGLSKAAVSLALRNAPGISLATRTRVQEIARRLDYRPDALVRQLSSQIRRRSPRPYQATLAWLTVFPERDEWRRRSPLWLLYFEGACKRAKELGYEVEEFWMREPGLSGRRAEQILRARGIRGLLIAPGKPWSHLALNWNRFASVTLGFTYPKPRLHYVSSAHYHSVTLALRQLKKRGYRRIGFAVAADVDRYTRGLFKAGFFRYQAGITLENRIPPLDEGLGWNQPLSAEVFTTWFQRHRPDAVVFENIPIRDWLKPLGMKSPGDVGLVKLVLEPGERFSGIDEHAEHLGASAVDLLVDEINRNQFGVPDYPKGILIDGVWREGKTTRQQQ